jgi:type IV fimbrial biogenesis protein FimT
MPRTPALRRLSGRWGFSALEIVVALAVVALLAGLALPTYLNYTSNQRALAAARTLMADLRLAQQEALTRRIAVTVNAARADVACAGGAASYTLVANEEVVKRACLSADVAWAERPTETFMFEPTGVPSSGATFALRSLRTGQTHATTVSPGGEISDVVR